MFAQGSRHANGFERQIIDLARFFLVFLTMLSSFKKNLNEQFPDSVSKKTLLAVSGGIDSMVLADLYLKSNFNFGIAHCNFNLRDQESDADQQFVSEYCSKNKIPFFTTSFDTKAFAKDYKLSTQVAARQLRYAYFDEILKKENYDFLATGHHLDDNIETVLIHFSRGTGINGLTGIPPKNDKIIRPLLAFSRNEIENYATENGLSWREDASNATDAYLRNKIRHHLTPILKEINPSFTDSFQQTIKNLQQAQSLIDDASRIVYKKVVREESGFKKIMISELKQLPNYKAYLYQWLQPLGFTAWDDIYNLAEAETGKRIFSAAYQLLKNRNELIVAPKQEPNQAYFEFKKGTLEVNFHIKLLFCNVSHTHANSNKTIFVDGEKLENTLSLRRWKTGDIFYPLGMNGQSKKVSKFFKDEKHSQIEKENTWLLCSGAEIVWIVGLRADERFKVTDKTQNIVQIDLV